MKKELDEYLCNKYPKIFAQRHLGMHETCMCWGFTCGDGWFNIIDNLCDVIQHHIDFSISRHDYVVSNNNIVEEIKQGKWDLFDQLYTNERFPGIPADEWDDWINKTKQDWMQREVEPLPTIVEQVEATQVKEKLGGLRFYVNTSDGYIDGAIDMAEATSLVTCEVCGSPGTRRDGRWIRTLCDLHFKEGYNIPPGLRES